jgi:hypothetical protein
VPRRGRVVEIFDELSYHPPAGCASKTRERGMVTAECRAGPSWVVAQRFTGSVEAGDALWFDTLLVPHGPDERAEALASGTQVIHSDSASLALRLQLGEETWTVIDRPQGASLPATLGADVGYAITAEAPGRTPYVLTRDASALTLADGTQLEWPSPTSTERADAPQWSRRIATTAGTPGRGRHSDTRARQRSTP